MENSDPKSYFNNTRDDLISLLPAKTKHLLDVGCGYGSTGFKIKNLYKDAEVIGIEINKDAARTAKTKLDKVVTGDLDSINFIFPPEYFDCIICGDILEHLKEPWEFLNKIDVFLKKDGVLLVSLPNLGHIVPILKIVFNRFEYEDAGILDRTHLRFFTLHTMKKMFTECGYKIVKTKTNYSNSWKFKLLNILSFGIMKKYFIYQYLFILVKK